MSARAPLSSLRSAKALHNTRVLPRVVFILAAGFLTTSLISFLVSSQVIRDDLVQQTLPLTGDTIYSNIQKDILQPVLISAEMANNTFLRDWMLSGERDMNDVTRYLKAIKEKHGIITAFVASEKTMKYYHPDGLLTTLKPSNKRDAWYARVRALKAPYETNVGLDSANNNVPTIYIDYRMLDEQGTFIGVTGVGLTLENLRQTVWAYERKFKRRIFFTDREGNLTLTSAANNAMKGNIKSLVGFASIAPRILEQRNTPQSLSYRQGRETVQVNSRFIPELGWYLIVEQNEGIALQPLRRALLTNMLIALLATLLVLSVIVPTLRRFQDRLEKAANTDGLTGLVNRQAFDLQFEAHVRDTHRNPAPFTGVLFDIDHFKSINDRFGHPVGDHVLREVATLTQQTVRESDLVARWGGEEFMVLLKNCDLNAGQELAHKIRTAIEQHDFGQPALKVTVSVGVAAYQPGETPENFLLRADRALYQAKGEGRNLVRAHHTT